MTPLRELKVGDRIRVILSKSLNAPQPGMTGTVIEAPKEYKGEPLAEFDNWDDGHDGRFCYHEGGIRNRWYLYERLVEVERIEEPKTIFNTSPDEWMRLELERKMAEIEPVTEEVFTDKEIYTLARVTKMLEDLCSQTACVRVIDYLAARFR